MSESNDANINLNTVQSKVLNICSTTASEFRQILTQVHWMTPKWHWILQGQRYLTFVILVPPSTKFHYVLLYKSIIFVLQVTLPPNEHRMIPKLHSTLEGSRYLYMLYYYPHVPNFIQFHFTHHSFRVACHFKTIIPNKRPMGLDALLENQLGHSPLKFQKLHIYTLSTQRGRNSAYFRSTGSGFRDTGRFSKLPYWDIGKFKKLKFEI